ncbi:MAG: hypothetical protein A4E23_00080 [Methanomethylovorans sp. PtaU1.Bin073]|nr:MAG: hypothetical protein A4E23_00080 [Methanomethylovorans sp. PtaU1.Bin073]
MPEEEPQRGNRWTEHAVQLLTDIGWTQSGSSNVDIPCSLHRDRRHPHGIDLFMTYFDPYQNCKIGIIGEAKNYAWRGINRSNIQNWINELIQKIECVPYSDEFYERLNLNHLPVNTGLLMIWAHDSFDKAEFINYLNNITIPKKRSIIRIFVLGNHEILKLYSLKRKVAEIRSVQNSSFNIFYPSYQGNDSYRATNLITLEYIKSKYIFGKMTQMIQYAGTSAPTPINCAVVFYFDKLTFDALKHMYLALRRFQLTEQKIIIYYYLDETENIEHFSPHIEQFKREYSGNERDKFNFEPIEILDSVPWRVD